MVQIAPSWGDLIAASPAVDPAQAPSRERAWDCATGSGQAAVSLAEFFGQVLATDPSEGQLSQAHPHERVRVAVMEASRSFWADQKAAAKWRLNIPVARRLAVRQGLARVGKHDEDLADRVIDNFDDYRALAARDQQNIKRLTAEMRARLVIQVPYLDADVHDLPGLMRINDYLFASGARERSVIAAET